MQNFSDPPPYVFPVPRYFNFYRYARAGNGTYSIIRLTAPTGALIADGDTLTLDDGFNAPVVFEFDSGGGVGGGNVAIAFTALDTAAQIAAAVAAAVNAQRQAGTIRMQANVQGILIEIRDLIPGLAADAVLSNAVPWGVAKFDAVFIQSGMVCARWGRSRAVLPSDEAGGELPQ